MTWTIRVLNWKDFQHYKDRDPPWIKLHGRRLLDKPGWRRLHGTAAKLLVDVWMLAAQLGEKGELDMPLTDLAFRVRLSEAAVLTDLQVLGHHQFLELCPQLLAGAPKPFSEAERETETEAEKSKHGADAPAQQETSPETPSPEMGRLMGLVRKHLYRGEPPEGWNPARDGSILKRLLASGVSPETTAAAIEGLAILRDWPGKYGKQLDWLKPGEKCTMRTLWHTRSGDYQTFQLALDACWKRHNVGKPPLPPTVRDILAKMVA